MRGRPDLNIPKKRVTFNLDENILAKYEMLIYDPISNRSRWGLKSGIVDKLLDKFVQSYITGETTINVRDLHHMLRN